MAHSRLHTHVFLAVGANTGQGDGWDRGFLAFPSLAWVGGPTFSPLGGYLGPLKYLFGGPQFVIFSILFFRRYSRLPLAARLAGDGDRAHNTHPAYPGVMLQLARRDLASYSQAKS